jgi:hypothetical protein
MLRVDREWLRIAAAGGSPRGIALGRMKSNPLSILALTAAVLLSACSSASTEVLPSTVSVSIGQQLIDLKKARDAGALSDREYQAQVRRLVDSVR